MKSNQQNHSPQKLHSGQGPVATGESKPSGTTLDRDLAQGYIVIVFVYVLVGALFLTFYILRKRSSKRK